MARHHAAATKLMSRDEPLTERFNRTVLQALRDLKEEVQDDPGIEDEYEYELFGNALSSKKKR
jgi:hypothetical protein